MHKEKAVFPVKGAVQGIMRNVSDEEDKKNKVEFNPTEVLHDKTKDAEKEIKKKLDPRHEIKPEFIHKQELAKDLTQQHESKDDNVKHEVVNHNKPVSVPVSHDEAMPTPEKKKDEPEKKDEPVADKHEDKKEEHKDDKKDEEKKDEHKEEKK